MTVLLNILLALGIAAVALGIFGCACSLLRRVQAAMKLLDLRERHANSNTISQVQDHGA